MKQFSIFCLVIFVSLPALAQRRYIYGIQRVTFRTGPGTDNKIIKMLDTNSRVTLIEEGEKWSKVKDEEGNEGYILTRFVTKDTPYILRYQWLKAEFDKQKEKNTALETTISELKTELADTKSKLGESEANLTQTTQEFEDLKSGSADYIGLKKDYEKTVAQLKMSTEKVKSLEEQVNAYYIKWFLAGGSVLFLGWLIGLISRKKKYQSSIRL